MVTRRGAPSPQEIELRNEDCPLKARSRNFAARFCMAVLVVGRRNGCGPGPMTLRPGVASGSVGVAPVTPGGSSGRRSTPDVRPRAWPFRPCRSVGQSRYAFMVAATDTGRTSSISVVERARGQWSFCRRASRCRTFEGHGVDPGRPISYGLGRLLPRRTAGPLGGRRRVLDRPASGHGQRLPAIREGHRLRDHGRASARGR